MQYRDIDFSSEKKYTKYSLIYSLFQFSFERDVIRVIIENKYITKEVDISLRCMGRLDKKALYFYEINEKEKITRLIGRVNVV